MSIQEVAHKGISDRSPSPKIWGRIPALKWAHGDGGFFHHDDFCNFANHDSAQATQQYASYIDTGVTIRQIATVDGGAITVTHDGTDNDEGSIQIGGNTGVETAITAATLKLLAFECRIKKSSIADDGIAFFVGLMEEGRAVADTLVDNTGAVADKDFIGFRNLHDNGEEVDFVYKKAGQTLQETAIITSMAADTWIKLGFLVDPIAPPSKRIKIFVNNTEYTTYVTQTQIEAATFPSGEEMGRIFATKIGTASAFTASMDWWRLGFSLV